MPANLDAGQTLGHLSPWIVPDPLIAAPPAPAWGAVRIGLVNNMPDAALLRTERQFAELIAAATQGLPVQLELYSLPAVPRTDWGREHLATCYAPVDELWVNPPDALIVTGAEPRARNLDDEPYWDDLTGLIDWLEDHRLPAMFSCLAAHAAVLYLDRVARRPLERKCLGIFDDEIVLGHPVTEGLLSGMPLPHSRWNEVPEDALTATGYRILTRSAEAGVGFFARERRSLWLFCQGHPEYDGPNLLREYRRDIGRFLRREHAVYPDLPRHYVGETEKRRLLDFRRRAIAAPDEAIMAAFPAALPAGPRWDSWKPAAAHIFRNWLDRMAVTHAGERPPV